MEELSRFLEPDEFIDSDHSEIVRVAHEWGGDDPAPIAIAIALYDEIRDRFRYNPWQIEIDPATFRASAFLARGEEKGGHCIDKATLLAACARARGIAARLHFANVRNHIGVEDLIAALGTDLLVFHGYAELHLDGKWVAATPAFNRGLCEKLGVEPLEFDGKNNSVFQQFDREGGAFMEYVHDYGPFPTLPFDKMIAEWKKYYGFFREGGSWNVIKDRAG